MRVGNVVPADLRLIEAHELQCDESVLTGESQAAAKKVDAQLPSESSDEPTSCAFMGTLVRAGDGRGVIVGTGIDSAFGRIALRLGQRHEQTAFQRGLQDFARMLVTITAILAGSIFLINVGLGRSILQSALFALAIAVGLTPQLLPAIVTVSLATGARRLAGATSSSSGSSVSRTLATSKCCSPTRPAPSPKAESRSTSRSTHSAISTLTSSSSA